MNRNWLLIAIAAGAGVPAGALRILQIAGQPVHLSPVPEALLFGLGIVGAAFLLAWAAEVAEMDISATLALAILAIVAVLPEYAVDIYFAWQAGVDPSGPYVAYATANMTGANRLLVGLGWPLVALLFWLRRRQTLYLAKGLSLEILFMGAATVYALTIPFKGSISLIDMVVLVSLFGLYIWLSSRAPHEEPEPVGPAATIGALPKAGRRTVVVLLFLYCAIIILASAEPFAEALLDVGRGWGVDEFIMVQWVAPLASETPEILIAVIFTLRGMAAAAMTAVISAKVNQWTLLVGTLPLFYSLARYSSAGQIDLGGLPLDARQMEEVWLTAAQSFFAVILLVRLRISVWGGLALFLLWVGQLALPGTEARYAFIGVYLAGAVALVAVDRGRLREIARLLPSVVRTATGGPVSK